MQMLHGQPAPELNDALIQQTTKPLHNGLLLPVQAVGADKQPVDFCRCDHTGAEGLEEELPDGHGICNEVVTSCSFGRRTAGQAGQLSLWLGLRWNTFGR